MNHLFDSLAMFKCIYHRFYLFNKIHLKSIQFIYKEAFKNEGIQANFFSLVIIKH